MNHYKLSVIAGKGIGLIATNIITKGATITKSPLVRLTEEEWKSIEGRAIGEYVYTIIEESQKIHFLCLGDAAFINHSSTPNVSKEIIQNSNPNYVLLRTIDDVNNGEELCISYTNPSYYNLT